MRKVGITIAHSVPYGRVFPGAGSIISLNGKPFDEAVLRYNSSLFAQWRTARGVFPATVIGIMSKWRELYRNAELAYNHMQAYLSDSKNKVRPSHDQATEGLFGVVNGTMPVFFKSESDLEIRRVIQLKKDLGFDLVVGEIKTGDAAANQLAEVGGRALVSLDLPKPANEKEDDLSDDQKLLLARKKGSITKATQQIGTFGKLIPTTSFSFLDVKSGDIMKNIRRMIENGLSEEDALASLTTRPAEVLGISHITGSIEAGKIANLVVTTKPLFDEKSRVKMVFVDGVSHKYDVSEKSTKKNSESGETNLAGKWSYVVDIPGMPSNGVITLSKDGGSYSGTVTTNLAPGEEFRLEKVERDGSSLTFTCNVLADGVTSVVEGALVFKEDSFEGNVEVSDLGNFSITGKRNNPDKF